MDAAGPVLLRGTDRAAFAVALVARLRARGVPVGFTALGDLARAMRALPPTTRTRLYWTTRICLVRRHDELAVFDAVFAAVFEDAVLAMDPHARRQSPGAAPKADDALAGVPKGDQDTGTDGTGLPWVTLPREVAGADASDSEVLLPLRLPSELAALAEAEFDDLDETDMATLGRWLAETAVQWPTRRSRRVTPDRSGHRVALRPTVARSRRTGWEPIQLVRTRPVQRPRRVVMLCDVSRSMQAQATAYLHLMRALTLTRDAEVFAFATSLTRLTPALAHRSAAVALERASATVTDRFGGTRIASNIAALLASPHGDAVRGAVVILASDGWDSDPPAEMARAMARLRRRAYRVVWINPRAAAPGFAPTVASMAAAVEHCDALLPADTFASLAEVLRELSRSGPVSSRA